MPSIQDIPAELKIMIAQELHNESSFQSLRALSQVSHTYQDVAEPSRYQSILLDSASPPSWTNLFLTLLHRPELARHIKTVRLIGTQQCHGSWDEEEDMKNRNFPIEKYSNLISDRIDTVLAKMDPVSLGSLDFMQYANAREKMGRNVIASPKMLWLQDIMDKRNQADDAMLALILCMATNVTSISIDEQRSATITRTLMCAQWKPNVAAPFQKLVDYQLSNPRNSSGLIPLLPLTRTLCIDDFTHTYMYSEGLDTWNFSTPQPMPTRPKLETMTLDNLAGLSIPQLIVNISSPWFANLKTFTMRSCGELSLDNSLIFDLVRALAMHAPNLEKLTIQYRSSEYSGLGLLQTQHFRGLTCLKELVVDCDMLVARGEHNLNTSFSPSSVLPSSLQTLVIDDVSEDAIKKIFSTIKSEIPNQEDPEKAVAETLALCARSLTVKKLALNYASGWMGVRRLSSEDVVLLRQVADVFHDNGVEFEFGTYYGSFEPLVKAGFTEPKLSPEADEEW
ncbi:hypothetical protein NX059_005418 [Plenodomus lindquistii]|nr:hypothetical protein NX059_005418 [Plenodomus lindquistii]